MMWSRTKLLRKGTTAAASALLALALVLTGCGGKEEGGAATSSPQATVEATVQPSPTAEGTVYPLKLTDATGTEVVFEQAPERIVTLVPSETEAVFALGAGDKVVGVDKWSDYPEEAKSKPQIGDMNPDIEAIVAAKPDVVFAHASMSKAPIAALRDLGIKVYGSDPKTILEVIEKIELYGQILNAKEQATKVADEMRADLKLVTEAVKDAPKKQVYMEMSEGWTVGDGEFLSEMLELAGGINVAGGKPGWMAIDPEAIIKANPEVIIYSEGEAGMPSILDAIKNRPGFEAIDAVKNGNMHGIDSNLTNRVSPRVTKGLLEIAKAVHPDLVK